MLVVQINTPAPFLPTALRSYTRNAKRQSSRFLCQKLWIMRITEKYRKALEIGQRLKITTKDREEIYQQLNSKSYFWNSEKKKWEKIRTKSKPPTELIKIRIWADARITEAVASELIEALSKNGLRVMNCSEPYQCYPPKGLESRVYIDFVKNPEESNNPKNGDVVLGGKKK